MDKIIMPDVKGDTLEFSGNNDCLAGCFGRFGRPCVFYVSHAKSHQNKNRQTDCMFNETLFDCSCSNDCPAKCLIV